MTIESDIVSIERHLAFEEVKKVEEKLSITEEERQHLLKIAKYISTGKWWLCIQTHSKPYPHMLEEDILHYMPPELHEEWQGFMLGKTGFYVEDTKPAIYPWDFLAFIRNMQKLKHYEIDKG